MSGSTRTDRDGWGLSVAGLIVLVCGVLAGAMIWLMLTDPVTVASAVDEGEVSPLVRELAQLLYAAVARIVTYL